ncbi:MAG: hypothetical protein CPSOU_6531 [uncultured Paraburkholderia sp.]|nr:MAG: hypothetical protein CPSOU_6531 [uncultured Paraburkholderia sp.]
MFRPGNERIVSLGSFSKILAPGIRIGWMHTTSKTIERIAAYGVLASAGGVSPVTSLTLAELLDSGAQGEVMAALNRAYHSRRRALCGALQEGMPPWVGFDAPSGGFFAWLTFPRQFDMSALRERAAAAGIEFYTGDVFSCELGYGNCMRLAFTYYPEPVLSDSGRRLCEVVRNHSPIQRISDAK